MKYAAIVILLAATYVTLTSNLQWINLLFGLIIGVLITALLRPPVRTRTGDQWVRFFVAGLRYMGVLITDLILSGIQTAQLVLSPKLPVNPGVLRIPSNSETDLGTALSAHAITLTPGELVVEMDDDNNMYTHALDVYEAAANIGEAQEMRRELLDQIFP